MLNITFKSSYRKRDSSVGFIYTVTGEEKDLQDYIKTKVAEGLPEDKVKTKDGVILFSSKYSGAKAPLVKSVKGNYYADTTEFDIMISTQQQIHNITAKQVQEAA